MPPPKQLGPRQIAKAVAMRRKGRTLAHIAKELGSSTSVVSRALHRAEQAGAKVPTATTGRPRKAKPRSSRRPPPRRAARPPKARAPKAAPPKRKRNAAAPPRLVARAVAMRRKGETFAAIALALGRSPTTVKRYVKRAEQALAAAAKPPPKRARKRGGTRGEQGKRGKRGKRGTRGGKRGKRAPQEVEEQAAAMSSFAAELADHLEELERPEPTNPLRGRDHTRLPSTPDELLEDLQRSTLPRLALIRRDATHDGNMPLLERAIKAELQLAERIRNATPTPDLDPKDDPANRAARNLAMARISSLVSRHMGTLCEECRTTLGLD